MGVYLDEERDMIRYFGSDVVYGYDGNPLSEDVIVHVFFAERPDGKGGLHDMPVREMIEQRYPNYDSIPVYPIAYRVFPVLTEGEKREAVS